MKLLTGIWIAFCIILLNGIVKAVDKEEGKEMIRGMSVECRDKEGATENDVEDMINKVQPTTPQAKCLNACMMEQFNIIQEGKFNGAAIVELTKMAEDEDLLKTITEITDECKDVEDGDRCELAVKVIQCMAAGAEKRGLKE